MPENVITVFRIMTDYMMENNFIDGMLHPNAGTLSGLGMEVFLSEEDATRILETELYSLFAEQGDTSVTILEFQVPSSWIDEDPTFGGHRAVVPLPRKNIVGSTTLSVPRQ